MKLYTFEHEEVQRLGAEREGRLVDLSLAHAARLAAEGVKEPPLPADLLGLLRAGDDAIAAARRAVEFAAEGPAGSAERITFAFEEVQLLAPLPRCARPPRIANA